MAVFISIDDVWVNEGDAGATFTLRLSEQSLTPVTLIWGLDSGTAGYNSDFTGVTNQTLTFDPGQLEQTIFVPLLSDTSIEGPQTFRVVLSGPIGRDPAPQRRQRHYR